MAVFPEIAAHIARLTERFPRIPRERKALLRPLADYIAREQREKGRVKLTFICTHNSRRSHISQIWAQAAADYYRIPGIECYSGGTEATAFNPRAVKALAAAGFRIEKQDDTANPLYLVRYAADKSPVECFSKVYSHAFNPREDFAAVMTCSEADANCPVVAGAAARFAVPYADPKQFDHSPQEEAGYRESVEEIGAEMLWLFSRLRPRTS